MSRLAWRIGAVALGVVLGSLPACQTAKPHAGAGALPTETGGAVPRLNASTYVAHGQLLERQGDLEKAAAQYRKALELTPELAAARNRLGITLNKLGQHAAASTEYRQAVGKNPKLAYLHNNLGFSLYLEHRYADAERELAKALELQPVFRRARMNHGLVLAKLERYPEAFQEFKLAGSEADAHYNVAVLQAAAGHYVEAVRALDQALRLEPNLNEAREQLSLLGALAAAEEARGSVEGQTVTAADSQVVSVPAESTAPNPPPAEPAPVSDLPKGAGLEAGPATDSGHSSGEPGHIDG